MTKGQVKIDGTLIPLSGPTKLLWVRRETINKSYVLIGINNLLLYSGKIVREKFSIKVRP